MMMALSDTQQQNKFVYVGYVLGLSGADRLKVELFPPIGCIRFHMSDTDEQVDKTTQNALLPERLSCRNRSAIIMETRILLYIL